MQLLNDVVVYSPSDLSAAATCEWALMRRLDAKLGRIDAVVDEVDEMLKRAGELGEAHEQRTLATLKKTREVVEFNRPKPSEYTQAAAETEAALRKPTDVLFQATFFDGRLIGFADFIMLNKAKLYEVYDTKLARKAKITALLQLAAYGDQLDRLGIATGDQVHLILGNQKQSSHDLADILPVYLRRRLRLERLLDDRQSDTAATPWNDPRYTACGRCTTCLEQVAEHRDVLMVAGVRLTQRARLASNSIHTIERLADSTGPVDGIANTTIDGLRAQAKVQLASTGKPAYEVFRPSALRALPAPNPGDIFFDFEGDPLFTDAAGVEWGLDYLFGMVDQDETFRPLWAHTYAEEAVALKAFLAYVAERRTKYPDMHIYHYAAYERTHLLSLAARHGVGENQVDDLLRDNVLVDLYPILKKALRVGSHSYSIKKLEPLYMAVGRDQEGVTGGADSVTAYAESRQLLADGEEAKAQATLDEIATYNEYDCVSTLHLRNWLLSLAGEHGIQPASPIVEIPVARDPSPVHVALTAHLTDLPFEARTPDDTAVALAAAAIDYHRREGKKFWQDHYDRLMRPLAEWADTRNVLAIEHARVESPWHKEGRQTKHRRTIAVSGVVAPGSSFKVGTEVVLVYGEDAAPPIRPNRSPGSKASSGGVVLEELDGLYLLEEILETGGDEHDELPIALAPGAPPNAHPQPAAIEEWGQRVLDALPGMLPNAALDILRRQPPRGVLAVGDPIPAIRDSLLGLDHSYLAVQGPPGTGKTYTGSRVISELVALGWKIGVVAQSHETVKNMLHAVIDAGVAPELVGKRPKDGDASTVPWTSLTAPQTPAFTAQPGGWVLGGTDWTFAGSNNLPRETLDLLVIDEAGQFSLASTIAAAVSAKRLLLLGDPQQLPQVSQGSHPEPVDVSALGWLSDGHDVLPAEFGFFLAKSWRMHPAVCKPVSRLSYEGKLFSQAEDRLLVGVEPGLHPEPIVHAGNATSSVEEAQRVVELVRSLLGKKWTIGADTRPLAQSGVIVVAPYNAQVELVGVALAAAGFADVPVGTVDKFQGREAAVSIVSLAASSAEEVPRGLEFLLLANRLNVAISRAQWAAYLLYSPALLDYLPTNATTLAQLSAFIRLVGE